MRAVFLKTMKKYETYKKPWDTELIKPNLLLMNVLQ